MRPLSIWPVSTILRNWIGRFYFSRRPLGALRAMLAKAEIYATRADRCVSCLVKADNIVTIDHGLVSSGGRAPWLWLLIRHLLLCWLTPRIISGYMRSRTDLMHSNRNNSVDTALSDFDARQYDVRPLKISVCYVEILVLEALATLGPNGRVLCGSIPVHRERIEFVHNRR